MKTNDYTEEELELLEAMENQPLVSIPNLAQEMEQLKASVKKPTITRLTQSKIDRIHQLTAASRLASGDRYRIDSSVSDAFGKTAKHFQAAQYRLASHEISE